MVILHKNRGQILCKMHKGIFSQKFVHFAQKYFSTLCILTVDFPLALCYTCIIKRGHKGSHKKGVSVMNEKRLTLRQFLSMGDMNIGDIQYADSRVIVWDQSGDYRVMVNGMNGEPAVFFQTDSGAVEGFIDFATEDDYLDNTDVTNFALDWRKGQLHIWTDLRHDELLTVEELENWEP